MFTATIEGNDLVIRVPLNATPTLSSSGKTLVVAARDPARVGWKEAIRSIPQEAIDRDFEESRAFGEMPNEWDAQGWQWPQAGPNEKV